MTLIVWGQVMTAPSPIPAGSKIAADREARRPSSIPQLPACWTATVLLSPFGDSISPLANPSQLVVGIIESALAPSESWMRVALYLTQNQRYCEFVFRTATDDSDWYWIDADPNGACRTIFGP